MPTALAILVFLGSLALTLAAAAFFADRLDHLGPRIGLPEAIVGLLTAVAADAPEISSAVIALVRGDKNVSLGVVLGSNAFNLAAMVGLAAVLTGAITIDRHALAVEGAVGIGAALLATVLIVRLLPAWVVLVLFAEIAVAYLVVVSRTAPRRQRRPGSVWQHAVLIVPAVALIVLGATGMVRSALDLAGHWHVSAVLVGVLLLAVLTSLPNAYTGVRLGLARRNGALVSETLGSNTINLVGGVLVPGVVVGVAARSSLVEFDLAWMLLMTVVVLCALARSGGMRRGSGVLVIALYAAFVSVQLVAR
jgi:cation:H+ antiporter